jgi:hypothetical protein
MWPDATKDFALISCFRLVAFANSRLRLFTEYMAALNLANEYLTRFQATMGKSFRQSGHWS